MIRHEARRSIDQEAEEREAGGNTRKGGKGKGGGKGWVKWKADG